MAERTLLEKWNWTRIEFSKGLQAALISSHRTDSLSVPAANAMLLQSSPVLPSCLFRKALAKKKKTVDRILLSRGHAEPIHLRSRPLKGRVMAMSSIQGQTCGYFQGGFLGGYVRSQSRPGVRGAAVSMLRSCWQIQTLTRVSGLSDMNGS